MNEHVTESPTQAERTTTFAWQGFAMFAGYLAVAQMLLGVAYGSGLGENSAVATLHLLGIWWAATQWWRWERHAFGHYSGIDTGLFLGYLWPIAIPYHLVRYRRLRGLGCLGLLLAAYLIPYYSGYIAAMLLIATRR